MLYFYLVFHFFLTEKKMARDNNKAFKCSITILVSQFSMQGESLFTVCRRLSTSILTPESNEGSFPSDLLTAKHVLTPKRTIGMGNPKMLFYLHLSDLCCSRKQVLEYC